MGFNIVNGLMSAGEGLLMSGGNPIAAAAMGVAGDGGMTAGNLAGNFGNAALGALDAQNEAF